MRNIHLAQADVHPRPKVSIITPTYQRPDLYLFTRMLESVRAQTYTNWEHLVCSDGAFEPPIAQTIARFDDPRRTYLVSSRHYGGFGAHVRQEVMTGRASGDYYVFLDDDNILLPSYLERMVDALLRAENGARFAICTVLHFGPLREDLGRPPLYLPGVPQLQLIDTLQVLVEAEAIRQVGWIHGESYYADGYTYEELGRRFSHVRVEDCLAIHL